ncbi:PstS family phosphate ABC transporter substrate-binding protein [Streptomyces sp. A7024]|uniref:Phosphate-binding protein n=1 Tax=Streptomyces coryli TaxID=1128680 RepID=A0A6G4U4Q7_9ACTN|nr:PstS family phosphate ABC transporter substrate-binding protein [Streptomyces coryli]
MAAVVLLAAAALAGCGSDDSTGDGAEEAAAAAAPGDEKPAADVVVDGSTTVAPLTKAARKLYAKEQDGTRVQISENGTGAGFERFCRGRTDISDASRPIKDAEKRSCATWNVKFQEYPVANDAVTVAVPRSVDWIDCISVKNLKRIWEPGSEIKRWNQIDSELPDKPLHLFGPGTEHGTFDFFTETINGEEKASRADYDISDTGGQVAKALGGDKVGLGYLPYTYYEQHRDTLRALAVDSGDGCVSPSTRTVQNGTYAALSRPLYIYTSDKSLKRDEVRQFVEFYLRHHAAAAKAAHYLPLSKKQAAELKSGLAKMKDS